MDIKPDLLKDQFSVSDSIISAPLGAIISIILIFAGGILTNIHGGEISYLVGAITISCYAIMIDGAFTMSKQLKNSGRASANQFVVLMLGSIVVFVNTAILLHEFSLLSNKGFPVVIVANTGIYVYLLLNILTFRLEQKKLLVKRDPRTDDLTQYVFTEEAYIPLLEKTSLEKSNTDGEEIN